MRHHELQIAALLDRTTEAMTPALARHLRDCARCRAILVLSLLGVIREAVDAPEACAP